MTRVRAVKMESRDLDFKGSHCVLSSILARVSCAVL